MPTYPFTILVDDDPLVVASWKLAAARAEAGFRAFTTAEDFVAALSELPRDGRLFLDSQLPGGVFGEELAGLAAAAGFREIYMATGLPPDRFAACPYLTGVRGKAPPWE